MNPGIRYETISSIGHLVLDFPPGNIMTGAFFKELSRITRYDIPKSRTIGIAVYGSGRHFSSGADLPEFLSHIKNCAAEIAQSNIESFLRIKNLGIPVIAAIRGICLGSGLELALACGFRVAGRGAVLGLPETEFGLMPGCGGLSGLVSLTGRSRAIELILRGETFSAEDAYKWSVVDMLVDSKDVVNTAVELITKFKC